MDPSPATPEPVRSRWKGCFQKSTEPLFFLNRQQRLVDVNGAWESLTGLSLGQVRGLSCRRRARVNDEEPAESLRSLLAPPPEVLKGAPARACRLGSLPVSSQKKNEDSRRWWAIYFFPLADDAGLLGILGKIVPVPPKGFFASQPLPENVVALRDRFVQEFNLDRLVAESPAMQRVVEQVRLAGQTALPLCLVGERGTGKHWLARCIHGQSAWRESAFACVDCSRLPHAALADLLFGDAGLGRRLRLGSLYLRRPELLPREMQDRLCQTITAWQDQQRGPRLLAGFTSAPQSEIQAGRLLPEFFCRLSPLVIQLPPLRERHSDLGRLLDLFLARAAGATGRSALALSVEAVQILQGHSWPGNLRELYQVLLQATQRAGGDVIGAADLPLHLRGSPPPAPRKLPLDSLLEQVEKRLIGLALRQAKNNKTEAAEILAIWRQRLLRRLQALGIEE